MNAAGNVSRVVRVIVHGAADEDLIRALEYAGFAILAETAQVSAWASPRAGRGHNR